MVLVKCRDCGKEFELEEGNNPSDFQCECEGKLEHDNEGYTPNLPLILIATASITVVDIFTSGFVGFVLLALILAIVGALSYQVNKGVLNAILTGVISICISAVIGEGLFNANIVFIIIISIISGAFYGAVFGAIGRILMRYIKNK